jgi:hypothetical protein
MVRPLSPHAHTGRRLPHHHTSYAALAFLSILAGVILMLLTQGALAAIEDTGQVQISAIIRGPAPQAPVITNPVSGARFRTAPILVEGICVADYKVSIFKNGVLAGSGICRFDATFAITIDLFDGRNELMARQYDFLDQSSPDSATVVVFLDRPIVAAQQLVLRTDSPYKVVRAGEELTWPVEVLGGTAPYALAWNWGDGSTDVISMTAAGKYEAKHIYTRPGNYRIVIKASDAKGQTAYLELLAVVAGEITPATSTNRFFDGGILLVLWPLYFLMVAMLLSFWLGERYEFYKVKQRLLSYRGRLASLRP